MKIEEQSLLIGYMSLYMYGGLSSGGKYSWITVQNTITKPNHPQIYALRPTLNYLLPLYLS